MKNIIVSLFLICFSNVDSQNLYNLSGWTPGTGNITDFTRYGPNSSNLRDYGDNNINNNVVLWHAIPNSSNNQDGGIQGSYKNIDPSKTYRFSIWFKKTNSNDGKLYFGCHSYSNGSYRTQKLNGDQINHPYFWQGDLPELNHWYLFIGYIHPNNYTGPQKGLILDGETGSVVTYMSIQDFKFAPSATNLRIRAFQNGTNNINDRAYLYFPTLQQINGNELEFVDLLNVNIGSKLVINYDAEGNQNQRFYCNGFCTIPNPESFSDDDIVIKSKATKNNNDNDYLISNDINIYPNPTSGILNIAFSKKNEITGMIEIFNINGQKVYGFQVTNQNPTFDISSLSSGTYIMHFHLNDGSSVNKKIIKK